MSRTPEGKVKSQVKAILKELDIYWFCPRGTVMGRSGIPDFICCIEGAFVSIETKAGNNKPTALQNVEMNRIKKAGGFSFVVNETNVDKLKNTLTRIIAMQRHCIGLLQAENMTRQMEAHAIKTVEKPELVTTVL